MNSSQQSRHASHAGSWYVSSGKDLNHQLSNWLKDAQTQQSSVLHAIISPHAGYSYCGSCAAYAYKQIQPENVKRVFILGPSHHVFLRDCALSPAITYETPLYNLTIDQEVYEELMSTGKFQKMSLQTDEDEHSIEMQLPYIAKAMESKGENGFTIVPVMVGSLDQSSEREYGKIFSKYIKDSSNLFVISSDFCHWGRRFNFTHYEEKHGDIYRYIETLDRQGMDLIENLDAEGFYQYLRKYRNTICGRHPIAVMLNAARTAQQQAGYNLRFQCRFLNYKQSSKCKNHNDNSVSYAAASLTRRDASSS